MTELDLGHHCIIKIATMITDNHSALRRASYGRRLGTVEPVFANITRMLELNRFTLRGKRKVNTQWLLYCLVHNIGKIHRYAPGWG